MSAPFVSVIIPVLDDYDALSRCLDALDAQRWPADRREIIVVDNGSRRVPGPRFFAGREVVFLVEPAPGVAAARNAGLRAARGDVIAFVDADCVPDPDWIAAGSEGLEERGCAAVAGSVAWLYARPGRPGHVERYDSLTYLDQEENVRGGRFGATANLFVRRECFDSVGLFDEDLPFGEDQDWGWRLADAGLGLGYVPGARVVHRARGTVGELFRRVRRCLESELRLYRKSPGRYRRFVRVSPVRGRFAAFIADIGRVLRDDRIGGPADRAVFVALYVGERMVRVCLLVFRAAVPERRRAVQGGREGQRL